MDFETVKLSNFKDLDSVIKNSTPSILPKMDETTAMILKKLNTTPIYEIDVERRKLLLILKRYSTSRFTDYLKSMNINTDEESFDKYSNDELERLLDDIRYTISQKNGNNMIEGVSLKAIETMESFMTNIYKIDGLSKVLKNNEQFLDTLSELSLEYSNFSYISPEKRMTYIIISNAMMVHQSHAFFSELSKTSEGQQEILNIQKKMEEQTNKK
jgi:hypothetical protein